MPDKTTRADLWWTFGAIGSIMLALILFTHGNLDPKHAPVVHNHRLYCDGC